LFFFAVLGSTLSTPFPYTTLFRSDIDGLDISCCNNFDKNKIVFKIVDEEGFVGTDSFYFQHVPGGLTLSAPEEIDFGTLAVAPRSEEHTSELQSRFDLVCRLLLEK